MTHEQLDALCAAIRRMKAASDRLNRLETWLEEQRDKAVLQTTKALFQTVLDRMEEAEP